MKYKITCGYIKIRWNQHNRHGGILAISDKNKLPAVAIVATISAKKTAFLPKKLFIAPAQDCFLNIKAKTQIIISTCPNIVRKERIFNTVGVSELDIILLIIT